MRVDKRTAQRVETANGTIGRRSEKERTTGAKKGVMSDSLRIRNDHFVTLEFTLTN